MRRKQKIEVDLQNVPVIGPEDRLLIVAQNAEFLDPALMQAMQEQLEAVFGRGRALMVFGDVEARVIKSPYDDGDDEPPEWIKMDTILSDDDA